ncbi:Ran GTPase binding protein, partial [Reticulomyxa filosa]
LKYGRYGSGYRTFRLSDDHKYLIWFSQKKDKENTRIPIKDIVEIKIGKESDVVRRSKAEDIHETSFTVVYGKDAKQLNVTAKSPKEAFVWAQGLKILSDAAKRGTNVSDLTTLSVEQNDGSKGRTNSVVISMEHVRNQSVMNMFQKNETATLQNLVKRHAQLKINMQRCVDFVMTKKNYKIIKVLMCHQNFTFFFFFFCKDKNW